MWYAVLRIFTLALSGMAGSALFPSEGRFVAAFIAVCLADSFLGAVKNKAGSMYLEELVSRLAVYAGLGWLASSVNEGLFLYTHRRGNPVVSALLLAILDGAWRPPALKRKRR